MYTRLNKLGICVSHKTSNIIVRKLGEKYDQKVRDWMTSCNITICSQKGVMPMQDGDQEQQLPSSQDGGGQASGDQQQASGDQRQTGGGQEQAGSGQRQADDDQGQAGDGGGDQRQAGGCQGPGHASGGQRQGQASRDQDEQTESCQGQEMQQVMVMPPQCYDVIFQGDNVDKNVHVRDMRVDNPNTSLHYFNSYAVKDRVPCPSSTHVPAREGATCSCYEVDSAQVPKDLRNAPCTTFLPSVTDCKNLRDSYIRIVATVLVENFTFLHQFKECIPLDLNHKYSDHMAKKSEIVS